MKKQVFNFSFVILKTITEKGLIAGSFWVVAFSSLIVRIVENWMKLIGRLVSRQPDSITGWCWSITWVCLNTKITISSIFKGLWIMLIITIITISYHFWLFMSTVAIKQVCLTNSDSNINIKTVVIYLTTHPVV